MTRPPMTMVPIGTATDAMLSDHMPEVQVTLNPFAVYAIVAVIGGCAVLALITALTSGRRVPKLPAPAEPTNENPALFPVSPPPPDPTTETPLPSPPPSIPWSTSPPSPDVDDPRR